MLRHACLALVVVPFLAVGCAGSNEQSEDEADIQVELKAATLADGDFSGDTDTEPDQDPSGIFAFRIGAFDADTGTLTLHNTRRSITARFTGRSFFFPARLDRYMPGDPCRDPASSYNVATDGEELGAVSGLVGCNARIIVNPFNARVLTFRPIP